MPDIQAVQSHLNRVQLRRKAAIWWISICFLPAIFFTTAHFKAGTWQRDWIEDFGALLIFVAILGRAWCTLYIGGKKTVALVKSGPYSISRNPLYFFSFVAVAGLGLQTGSISMAAFMTLMAYLIFLPVVLSEEAGLSSAHGAQYEAYRNAVPRFFPRPNLWQDGDSITANPGMLRRTIADGMVFVLLAFLIRGLLRLLPDLPRVTLY
ncbi:methyltransferase family protein [Brucella sp. IR073]|uniref:methyltransferase family protein n=1 Tax=unclassified Brucella TaxID=2632610 RepID=UPI003B97F8FC